MRIIRSKEENASIIQKSIASLIGVEFNCKSEITEALRKKNCVYIIEVPKWLMDSNLCIRQGEKIRIVNIPPIKKVIEWLNDNAEKSKMAAIKKNQTISKEVSTNNIESTNDFAILNQISTNTIIAFLRKKRELTITATKTIEY